MWKREPSLGVAMEEAWSRRIPGHDLGDVSNSLKSVMTCLYNWKNSHFKSVPREIEKKRVQLENLRQCNDEASVERRTGLEKEMDELLYREEIMWIQ
jgi:hypothetical protein